MSRSIYLINPASSNADFIGAEVYAGWGLRPVAPMADLATATVEVWRTAVTARRRAHRR